jgi:xanthine/CO dehydrogenase XdhC/CoxF family maturation factor
MNDTAQVLTDAAAWRRGGLGVALATVVSTWGSSPRPVGSKLAVNETGQMSGSVSGGCVESAVVHTALEIMRSGKSRLLEFGVSDEQAWEVGLACGGRISVYVERLS